jgi:8-oxo-dGTP diphosphatase
MLEQMTEVRKMQGINTTLCYIEQDGKYLMLHRVKKKNDINQDKWVGIGGKFEDKESPEDCIRREALEETGLTLTHLEYRGLVTFISDRYQTEYMHLFWADGFTGALKDCDEGVLEWISKEQLMSLPMWQGDEIFLDLLERRVPFFSLKLSYEGDRLAEAVLNGETIV